MRRAKTFVQRVLDLVADFPGLKKEAAAVPANPKQPPAGRKAPPVGVRQAYSGGGEADFPSLGGGGEGAPPPQWIHAKKKGAAGGRRPAAKSLAAAPVGVVDGGGLVFDSGFGMAATVKRGRQNAGREPGPKGGGQAGKAWSAPKAGAAGGWPALAAAGPKPAPAPAPAPKKNGFGGKKASTDWAVMQGSSKGSKGTAQKKGTKPKKAAAQKAHPHLKGAAAAAAGFARRPDSSSDSDSSGKHGQTSLSPPPCDSLCRHGRCVGSTCRELSHPPGCLSGDEAFGDPAEASAPAPALPSGKLSPEERKARNGAMVKRMKAAAGGQTKAKLEAAKELSLAFKKGGLDPDGCASPLPNEESLLTDTQLSGCGVAVAARRGRVGPYLRGSGPRAVRR